MSVQVIERNGKPEYAVVPTKHYLKLVEDAELLQDIRDYDEAKAALESGEKELIPSKVVYALLDGGNPVRVCREFRQISQQELAAAAGISPAYLSQIENGKRKGAADILARLAKELSVSLDDLV